MSVLPILTIPEPLLRKQAQPVERVDEALRRLIRDMLQTMYDAPGVGLAGPQVGVLRRVIVMDPAKDEQPPAPIMMINPEILERGGAMRIYEEGCLSIPEFYAELERPGRCRVRYLDPDGNAQERDCEGLLATIVQHEVDHLDGVLFIDYLSRLKRDMVIKRFTKAKKTAKAL